jgi:hypothetical protein
VKGDTLDEPGNLLGRSSALGVRGIHA